MHLDRRVLIKLAVFAVVSLVAVAVTVLDYVKVSNLIPGFGQYAVTLELPQSGGLYAGGNVTYRGTEVGRVEDVRVTETGVKAVLALKSGIDIPSDLDARVHSQSAVGEQYVALVPREGPSRPLGDGDVIPMARTSVPPDINSLLDATNTALRAIPKDNLKTVIDESYTAIGNLGPELSRIVKGSTRLAIDARQNLGSLTTLIDQSSPVLDSQADTSDSIQAWAANLADLTGQIHDQDAAVNGLLDKGPASADEVTAATRPRLRHVPRARCARGGARRAPTRRRRGRRRARARPRPASTACCAGASRARALRRAIPSSRGAHGRSSSARAVRHPSARRPPA